MDQFTWTLLADHNSAMFRNMGSGFRHKQENFNPLELVLWLCLLVLVFFCLHMVSRMMLGRKKRLCNRPRALLRALCRAHELDGRGRALVKQLAVHHRFEHANQVFVSPQCFEPRNLPAGFDAEAVARLKDKLFGPEFAVEGDAVPDVDRKESQAPPVSSAINWPAGLTAEPFGSTAAGTLGKSCP